MIDILCVGQIDADILVKPVNYRELGHDTVRVDTTVIKTGGDAMNVAINCAKLGNRVALSGKIGKDRFGDILISRLKEHSIDIRGIYVDEHIQTATAIALINEEGERVFLYCGGTNDVFSIEDMDLAILEECKVVHVGGTYMLPNFDGDGAVELFKMAKIKGKLTSMDVTYDTTGRWLTVIERCLPYLDYFMPSIGEASKIAGCDNPEEIAEFLHFKGVKNVVIKMGAKGAYVSPEKDQDFYVSAFKVPVVDTTGAGDSFVSGMLTGIIRKWDLRKCVEFASGVAAFCIQAIGATENIPEFEKVADFVNKSKNNKKCL